MSFYVLGILVGLIAALLIGLAAFLIHRKRNPGMWKYDERQVVGRGKSFQAGFFATLIAGAVCSILDYITVLPGASILWHIGALLTGVCVFAVTAIHYDAYIGMNETPKRFLRMGGLFILCMGLNCINAMHSGTSEGRVVGILCLEVAAVWIIILAALLLHRTKAEDEE